MKNKRILLLSLVSVLAVLLLSSVLVVSASASDDSSYDGSNVPVQKDDSFFAPQAGSLSVTILNTDTYASGPSFGEVVAFFDHNNSVVERSFVAGHYVGARICAAGSTISDVVATISSADISAFNPLSTTENVFMFGMNEVLTRSVGTLASGECGLAYYYVLTPRFASGGTESPTSPAEGMTAKFTISAGGMDDTPIPVSDSDNRSIYMGPSQSADPNRILHISTIDTTDYFTFVVDFDAGNVGSNEDATFNPTSYHNHNAGIFDLEGVEISIPGFGFSSTDILRIMVPDGSHVLGTITYTLKRVVALGDTEFYPIQHVNSGQPDKFNADVSVSQVPTAITLLAVGLESTGMSWIVPGLLFTLLLLITLIVLRVQRFRKQTQ
jgi:hypothetical protein